MGKRTGKATRTGVAGGPMRRDAAGGPTITFDASLDT